MNDLTGIMLVTFNRLNLTKQTLESLLKTTHSPFCLIVIDNGSTDGTSEYITNFCQENSGKDNFISHSIKINKDNKGIAIGRNQALKLASETSTINWLCTLDNDVILPDNWLGQAQTIIKENPGMGAVGVNFEKESFPLVKSGQMEFQLKPKGNLGTACMVFSRSLHKLLGYFNTEYGLYGMEDSDLGFRIRVAGFKLGYLKENGIHLGEGSEDVGPYREFKTTQHQNHLIKFNNNCRLYFNKKKSIFIPLKE